MRTQSTFLGTTAALAGVLTLALGAAPVLAGAQGAALRTTGTAVHGDHVVVQVVNPSATTFSGAVVVGVVLANGTTATATAPVTVPGGGAATVVVPLPDDVRQAIVMGSVLDDGTPFGPQ